LRETFNKVKICILIPGLLLALLLSVCGKEDSSDTDATTNDRAVLISMQKAEIRDLPIWLETVGQVHNTFLRQRWQQKLKVA